MASPGRGRMGRRAQSGAEGERGGRVTVAARYAQWKSLVPVLYDWLADHNLVGASASSSNAQESPATAYDCNLIALIGFCVGLRGPQATTGLYKGAQPPVRRDWVGEGKPALGSTQEPEDVDDPRLHPFPWEPLEKKGVIRYARSGTLVLN
ncbi:hypothetical protein MUK42_34877 [Musa troglodytarum]|uniref:Uncharacterized protein n=1 Tax=Musa troglodytarum TaxID=320322 RepID=A0A9E7E9C1_9LILI|nr:hypothetical protein MUK42_34877 [Musa troglodytarum]